MTEKRHRTLGLSDEEVLDMYRTMLRARRLDERTWLLNRAGKIPFVVSCQGQEGTQVAAAYALNRKKDYVLPYYRDIGLVLSFGLTIKDLLLSSFAKADDPASGGRQMPGHFGSKKHRILTGSSPVTTQVPHAAGIALAMKMEGKDTVTLTTFGEGSSNQGDFHEGLNFAGVHQLPVIFLCENNKYAISVPLSKQVAGQSVADRAAGYGMPGIRVDGNDTLEVYKVVKEAVKRARAGEGPTLIEAMCYRFTPHSSDDDDRSYREEKEVTEARTSDSLLTMKDYLMQVGLLTEDQDRQIEEEIQKEVQEATIDAENAEDTDPESIMKHVYAE